MPAGTSTPTTVATRLRDSTSWVSAFETVVSSSAGDATKKAMWLSTFWADRSTTPRCAMRAPTPMTATIVAKPRTTPSTRPSSRARVRWCAPVPRGGPCAGGRARHGCRPGRRSTGPTPNEGSRHARETAATRACPDPSTGTSSPVRGLGEAERVAAGVEQHPPGLTWLLVGQGRAEPHALGRGGVEVVDGQVEVELLGAVLVRPPRLLVVVEGAEPEGHPAGAGQHRVLRLRVRHLPAEHRGPEGRVALGVRAVEREHLEGGDSHGGASRRNGPGRPPFGRAGMSPTL